MPNLIINNDIINREFSQNCGDSLLVIEKTNERLLRSNCNGGEFLYKIKFLKYPYETLVTKGQIIKGTVNNPQIEQVEFIEKIWPQNCGDSLRIIEKSNKKQGSAYLWKCEFINQKYIVFKTKSDIIKGQVLNPLIEDINFIQKIWLQNCGDSLKIIEKCKEKEGNYKFYKYICEFINYPYKLTACKSAIISGSVDNPNLPWKTNKSLFKYIKENFNNKPTLEELSKKLGLKYSSIAAIIDNLNLKEEIEYYKEGSNLENEVRNYIYKLTKINYQNNWDILNGKEIDIYLPNYKLGIEFNGNFWHSELFQDLNNHQNKSLLAKEKGIKIFHIFEYEWLNKKFIVQSLIKSKLGIFDKRVGASKCKIKQLDSLKYSNFCNNNHIQGSRGAKVKLGLFYKDELVQVMSFGSPRFTDKYEWEIIRECSKLGYCVVGGKEKLWSYFLKNYNPNSVVSYCDFGKFTGESYLKLGFNFLQLNKPGFVWIDYKNKKVFWRNPYKHKEMSEKYLKLYDAGQLVFEWFKKE